MRDDSACAIVQYTIIVRAPMRLRRAVYFYPGATNLAALPEIGLTAPPNEFIVWAKVMKY